jgi:Protein of unknown function (DUF2490)
MNIRTLAARFLLSLALAAVSAGAHAAKEEFFGWYSLTMAGDLEPLSPQLQKVRWMVMNQSRLGSDSSTLRENLLFAQLGYQTTEHISLWLGYTHDWITPSTGRSFNENRIYQEFRWDNDTPAGLFTARTRIEQRFRDPGGNLGARFRQFFQLSWPVPGMDRLRLVGSEEVFVYMNNSSWGRSGFSENRLYAGVNVRFNKKISADLGYLNQFVSKGNRNDIVDHALFANINLLF